jgi:hypothetical protein
MNVKCLFQPLELEKEFLYNESNGINTIMHMVRRVPLLFALLLFCL